MYAKKEIDFGEYHLLNNNCLHYVQIILQASHTNNLTQKYIETTTQNIPTLFSIGSTCQNILNKIAQGVEKMEREVNKTIDKIEEFINGVIDFFTF